MIFESLAYTALIILSLVTALFCISIVIKRNDIADVAWGPGISLVAMVNYVYVAEKTPLQTLLLVIALLWATRLGVRIFLRNRKKGEDFRYKKWRDEWGKRFYVRSYFQVYLLQGLLMIVVGYPFIHAAIYTAIIPTWLMFTGIVVWCVGYFFETVGDLQLDRFMKQNHDDGTILSTGLWKYTRHPNYFGEVTMWWGVWLIVAALPLGYLALVSPLMISFLILKVSGIPMVEKRFEGNAQFEVYKRKTSAFIPLLPKR